MCQNCGDNGPNCHTTSALTWAIPVHVTKLGASLEAYESLKPVITEIRLCNRYGQGLEVHITKLPQELVDLVIEYLTIPVRVSKEKEWELIQMCSEHRCKPSDHLTESEYGDIRGRAYESALEDYIGDEDEGFQACVDEIVDEMLYESCLFYDTCEQRKETWNEMTDVSTKFAKFDKILRSEFGIAVYLSRQSITTSMVTWFYDEPDEDVDALATEAYLTIPSRQASVTLPSQDVCSREHYEIYHCGAQYSLVNLIDPAGLQLTEGKTQRLRRAMKFLNLVPGLSDWQTVLLDRGHSEQVLQKYLDQHKVTRKSTREARLGLKDAIRKRGKELELSKWPKLLNLVKSSYSQIIL